VNDRFFKGGQTFRGFETAGIGPRDTTFRNALGGKVFGIASLELTVPTFLPENIPIKASLFTDVGTLGGIDTVDKIACTPNNPPVCITNPAVKDNFALRAAAGISIGWRSPLGPIQFDISKVLAKEPYDETESFRFSTSTRF
jgi:outer membrane protein insertion porin family